MAVIPPPTPIPANPFDHEDLANINAHLANIQVGLNHVKLAKSAGIDVAEQEKMLNEAQAKLLRLKNVYFPGH